MKSTAFSIIIAGLLIGGAILLTGNKTGDTEGSRSNVTVADGKQIVEVTAGNGYSPNLTVAKADMPTVLRMETVNSFSCASALVIPKLGVRKNLPSSGTTDIDIPPQKAGSTLQGLCAMGMYNFSIKFE
ncbi:MAG: hypothetical protein EXS51_01685 [Candidatus Taylorbacteria bacterium]|nr:hypothetical protein [Candidatus Taylorbacteria bacterium]